MWSTSSAVPTVNGSTSAPINTTPLYGRLRSRAAASRAGATIASKSAESRSASPYEDPGIQVCFEGDVAESVADAVVAEVLVNITATTGQEGRIVKLDW